MSTTKRVSGTYTVISDNMSLNAPLVTINGNLVITGNSSIVESTNTSIYDNIIVLNSGLSPSVAPTLNAGITVDRGTQANVSLIWNESVQLWQLTTDGSNYGNIVVAGGATSGFSLSGNLDVQSYSIYSQNTAYVKFDENVAIKTTTVAPAAAAGYNVVSAQSPNGGGSGIYTTNSVYNNAELMTQTKGLIYSIIFG
jgi:hypothetical protein